MRVVLMNRPILATLCILISAAAISARAQVVPAATSNSFTLTAGALGSTFQPDYAGEGIAQTSPNRLWGVGAFVDMHFNRWVQLEGEGRWLHYNTYLGINQNTYLIGPRIPIVTYHRFTPYGKFLVGMGNGSFLAGSTFVMAYGGGVDYRLSRRFSLRGDFEYQQWRVTPVISPWGASGGISYKIF
jgi:Outer membrane protein beta-barrel domain